MLTQQLYPSSFPPIKGNHFGCTASLQLALTARANILRPNSISHATMATSHHFALVKSGFTRYNEARPKRQSVPHAPEGTRQQKLRNHPHHGRVWTLTKAVCMCLPGTFFSSSPVRFVWTTPTTGVLLWSLRSNALCIRQVISTCRLQRSS